MNDALLSSENMGFRTPPEFLDIVRSFAPIHWDAATDLDNPTGAFGYFAGPANGGIDALKVNWKNYSNGGLIYCNPPYGRGLANWADKFAVEGTENELLTLTPARLDTAWFKTMRSSADAFCGLEGRLTFLSQVPPEAAGTAWEARIGEWLPGAWNEKKRCWSTAAAPFPCAVFYWGRRSREFVKVFEAHGWAFRL